MTRKALDALMEKIREDIKEMADLASSAVLKATEALDKNDVKLAKEVMVEDGLINGYEHNIKSRSLQAMALQQPVAKDLRFLSVSMDVAYNFERIGDFAKDIAESLTYLDSGYLMLDEITQMGRLTSQMVKEAGEAFVKEDTDKIASVMKMEDRVDELYKSVFPLLKRTVSEGTENCSSALNLILISKFLERIGDHSVNIADRAMYKMSGREEYL
jgi:phosphate transport system protein